MNLALAVPFGVASAVVYGSSIVVQHRVAQKCCDSGEESASGLLRLVKHPMFLLAICGDAVGFVLSIIALSLGKVVVIQPLVVLMLPVSLAVSALTGGPRPDKRDYVGVLGVLAGLGVFLALIGHPRGEHVPHPRHIAMAVLLLLVVGGVLVLLVSGRNKTLRGAMYGVVAGGFFGTLAVMVDAASDRVGAHGLQALVLTWRGAVPLICILVLGGAGIALTQLSFQIGHLGATLPANLATDPAVAVIFGAVLLREHIPLSVPHVIAYVLCLTSVVIGARWLARSPELSSHDTPAPRPAAAASGRD